MKVLSRLLFVLFLYSVESHAATFTVTNANNAGVGSLRWAMTNAMASAAPREVLFNIPGAGPHVISVSQILPTITNALLIRGDTQPGFTNTPLVQILGSAVEPAVTTGLQIPGSSVLVRGLRFTGFRLVAIDIYGTQAPGAQIQGCVIDQNTSGISVFTPISGNPTIGGSLASNRNVIINNTSNGIVILDSIATIRGNYIGVDADGVTPAGNGEYGIQLKYADGSLIEGGPAFPQVISGNKLAGIFLSQSPGFSDFSDNNIIRGNMIGTDISGTISVSNGVGIRILGGSGNVVGGTTAVARNIIAGNSASGVTIEGITFIGQTANENRIIGNYIGLGADGETVLPNYYGVNILDTERNRIGGTGAGEGNLFGGATFYSVLIQSVHKYAQTNTVQGNWFGLSVSTQVLDVGQTGINIGNSSNNVIGGTTSAARNYFGGGTGIYINGTNSRNNQIIGNWIGVKPDGTYALINAYGIDIFNAQNNEVGGTTADRANTISGCQWYGVRIHGPAASGNIVQGNNIGSDPTGTLSISNRYAGVDIADGAYSNRIGATNFLFSAMNVISGNEGVGVAIRDSNTYGNVLSYNFIGLTRAYGILSNNSYGVNVFQSPGNQIGPANLVGNSQSTGLNIAGSNAVGNVVIGNIIGSDGLATRHPNSSGIGITGPGTIIGGVTSADRNYIGGNRVNGVDIGSGGHGTIIQGNLIGLDAFGTAVMSNNQYGVYVNNANNVIIGGLGFARNIISGSRLSGVVIDGSSSNTVIVGNYIGTTENGLTRIGNGTAGISVNADYTTVGVPFAGLGNVIVGANTGGIEVDAVNGVRIRNNSVGVGVDGVTNIPNARGIVLRNGSRNVQVGGTNALDANVIARNSGTEVWLQGSAGNRVEGNYIGVMNGGIAFPAGQSGLGMDIENSPSNQILNNVIGQVGDALRIVSTGSYRNVVQGNYIGEYNLEIIRNSGWGVYILNASDNLIGGDSTSLRNVIAHNAGGIVVTNTVGTNAINNRLGPSLIFSNAPNQNIDLGPRGLTTNDFEDADIGANNLQNKPFITNGITTAGGIVYAQGLLHSAPNTTYGIDIYRSGSTNAEGFRYLGRTYVVTDGDGNAPFTAGFPVGVASGAYLTATATDPFNNTSEFSVSPTGAVLVTTADTDGDGIPGYWEVLYGLNPAVSNAPGSDADMDTVSDYDEYIADTAANDGSKYLVVTGFEGTDTGMITFPSSSMRVYRLEDNMEIATNPAWSATSGYVTGFYGVTTLPATNLVLYNNYRVGVKLP